MQLKLKRSQREGGILSTTMVFCLDARVEFTPQETERIRRYKLHNQVIYNSEASARHLARADAHNDGSLKGSLRSLASTAMALTKLNISIASLQRGQRVECKSLDELLGAEHAVLTACENLKGYLDTAATFDGRMVVFDFETGSPVVVAQSVGPALVVPAASPPPSAPALAAPIVEPIDVSFEPAPPNAHTESPRATQSVMDMPASELLSTVRSSLSSEQQLFIFAVGGILLLVFFLYATGRAH